MAMKKTKKQTAAGKRGRAAAKPARKPGIGRTKAKRVAGKRTAARHAAPATPAAAG